MNVALLMGLEIKYNRVVGYLNKEAYGIFASNGILFNHESPIEVKLL
jgi:GDP-D-mannose dehydratase